MKRLGWITALAAIACTGTGEGMKFVGSSSEQIIPSNGLFAMYASCQQTFGAGHRMCTLAEILRTADVPTGVVGQSVYQGNLNSMSCGGWSAATQAGSTTPYYAPSVDEAGKFVPKAAHSGNEHFVACCGPN